MTAMNTTPVRSASTSENSFPRTPLSREQTLAYTRVSMVADMLEKALQESQESLQYTLILIADGALLEFNGFLQGRAEALLKRSTEVEMKFTRVFAGRHGEEEREMLFGNTLPLDAEIAIHRRTMQKQKFSAEEVQAAEAAHSDAADLYGQVECLMRAIDSYSVDGPDIRRVGAPRVSTLVDLPKDRRVSA